MWIGIEIARLADRELDSPVGQIDAGGLLAGLPEQLHTWRGAPVRELQERACKGIGQLGKFVPTSHPTF